MILRVCECARGGTGHSQEGDTVRSGEGVLLVSKRRRVARVLRISLALFAVRRTGSPTEMTAQPPPLTPVCILVRNDDDEVFPSRSIRARGGATLSCCWSYDVHSSQRRLLCIVDAPRAPRPRIEVRASSMDRGLRDSRLSNKLPRSFYLFKGSGPVPPPALS